MTFGALLAAVAGDAILSDQVGFNGASRDRLRSQSSSTW